ncbi:MAG: HAD family hydrolase [Clostridia bacterium]|nr:HAD family hydrolase [Clostridia bacterium]
MPVEAIAFDAGYTLLRPSRKDWFIPGRIFDFVDREKWESLDPEVYKRAYTAGYEYLDVIHDRVKTEKEEYFQFVGFFEAFAAEAPELGLTHAVCRALAWDHTYNDGKFIFYDDVKPALGRLKEKYSLGVLSDTWPSLDRIYRNSGIRDMFDVFVLSCDVGVFKPDPKMYTTLIDSFGVPADRIIFVDDVLKNLDAARAQGIRTLQILREPFVTGSHPTVRDMAELETYLESIKE